MRGDLYTRSRTLVPSRNRVYWSRAFGRYLLILILLTPGKLSVIVFLLEINKWPPLTPSSEGATVALSRSARCGPAASERAAAAEARACSAGLTSDVRCAGGAAAALFRQSYRARVAERLPTPNTAPLRPRPLKDFVDAAAAHAAGAERPSDPYRVLRPPTSHVHHRQWHDDLLFRRRRRDDHQLLCARVPLRPIVRAPAPAQPTHAP